MVIEFLGTAGATATPIPAATDPTSLKARARGAPYSRYSPCVYVHGPDLMIDMGEESRLAMDRAGMAHVPNCTFSHWHPDHVLGKRVFEFNRDWGNFPAQPYCTQVYLPEQVAQDAHEREGLWSSLQWYERWGWVKTHVLRDADTFVLNGTTIMPFRADPRLSYGFLLTEAGRRAVIVPDEVQGWQPQSECYDADVLILPQGLFEFNPITGKRRWAADHPIFRFEPRFDDILALFEKLRPKRAIITHLEAYEMPDYDELQDYAHSLTLTGRYGEVAFAWDTQRVVV